MQLEADGEIGARALHVVCGTWGYVQPHQVVLSAMALSALCSAEYP